MLPYKAMFAALLCIITGRAAGQELFVYSEPASNMPARSTGIRLTNWLMNQASGNGTDYHLIPELMWGPNRNLMVHAEGFLSNRSAGNAFAWEGAGLYAKYRFFSRDGVFRHFRMAAFGRAATNNGAIVQEAIQVNGLNSGYQAGLVATQLLHKTALSVTGYYERATDNRQGHEFPAARPGEALSYMLSAGHLMLPKVYKSYNQVNLNLMAEMIGQWLPATGQQYIDIAPSVQFIFRSQARLDVGYRQELYSNMQRAAPNGLLVRFEYLIFNITRPGHTVTN